MSYSLKFREQLVGPLQVVADELDSMVAELNTRIQVLSDSIVFSNGTSTSTTTVGGSPIKSIQRGTITISNTTSASATLATTLTDLTKSSVHINGWTVDHASPLEPDDDIPRITSLTVTTVTAQVQGTTNGNLRVAYEVIEYN